jgi:hypothetical protein
MAGAFIHMLVVNCHTVQLDRVSIIRRQRSVYVCGVSLLVKERQFGTTIEGSAGSCKDMHWSDS